MLQKQTDTTPYSPKYFTILWHNSTINQIGALFFKSETFLGYKNNVLTNIGGWLPGIFIALMFTF
jgi:hypothetical protein